ncbi:hypothetical protein [Bradyrhizobium sp. BWA-3-5]|uniref:hypothetical protein n=1 Tax=Bradyrhizobium sp. BWA-3-5 TaxID=3080013 RepID=UPI00293E9FD1|nr:hypothetical protein [Bradyrhizobium sp. BWA-3-5]WOH63782.1 hypothetical protein RX331_24140 [Bradyrhizobium sp. BWA-3-5]
MQNVPCYVFCKIRRRRQECDHEVFGWAKLTLSAVVSIFASTMAAPVQVIPPGPTAEAEQAPALDIDEHNTIKGIDVDKLD